MSIDKSRRKVLITALRENPTLSAGIILANQFDAGDFEIADDVREPDIVLYLEYGYLGLTDLPLLLRRVQAFPGPSHFVFSEADWPYPVLPGAYPSLRKRIPWAQTWCYLPKTNAKGILAYASASSPHLLFSFLGRSATHPVRKQVLALDTASSPCVDLGEAPRRFSGFDHSKTYQTLIADSKFVLCPRGFGASSIRIFEVMSLGRVPVIISDEWQPPAGVPWGKFCVFIREKDVLQIPYILRELEGGAESMGKFAQETFNHFFGPSVFYQKLLTMLVANYSDCSFTSRDNLMRAWRALGWREIHSVGSQAKSIAIQAVHRK